MAPSLTLDFQEIENQLRERFRRDLPSLIHRLSQKWLAELNQQPVASTAAPITVELEREPDESFGEYEDPDAFEYDSDEVERSMRAPSPAVSSDSELESEGDEAAPTTAAAAGIQPISAKHDRHTSIHKGTPSPSVSPTKGSPIKSFMDRVRQRTTSSSTSMAPPRDGIQSRPDSEVLRSLRGNDTNFATTFSQAPQPVDQPRDLLLTSLLSGASPSDRKATRRRIHRLESASPAGSPQKNKTLHKAKSRGELKRADMDEYFPVRATTAGGAATSAPQKLPPKLDYGMQKSTSEYPKVTGARYDPGSSSSASKPSLRRNMLSSRLRDPDFFTPNYPR